MGIHVSSPADDVVHSGSLIEILQAAPNARLITAFLGLGILTIEYQISLERVLLSSGSGIATSRVN